MPASMTSLPIPSPGITATLYVRTAVSLFPLSLCARRAPQVRAPTEDRVHRAGQRDHAEGREHGRTEPEAGTRVERLCEHLGQHDVDQYEARHRARYQGERSTLLHAESPCQH